MKLDRSLRRLATLAVAVALAGPLLSVTATADDPTTDPSTSTSTDLAWGACPDDVAAVGPLLTCATMAVPVDHTKPDGRTIDIMISRLASPDPAKRHGVLLLNPGGPGGAGLTQPADMVARGLPTTVSDAYDLIGMDPRGVGHSSPVSCAFTDDQAYWANVPPYARNAADVATQAKVVEGVADQCAANDKAKTMQHMSTANTARDMDLIRTALGEEKMSFYGASYGSALGATFASMFPARTDRIVLDSNLGATSVDRGAMRRFGLGMEQRFPDFAKFAAERHDSYGIGSTPAQVRKNYLSLAARLDKAPIAGVDGAVFRFRMFVGMYGDASFPSTAQFWQALTTSDTKAVQEHLNDQPTGSPGLPQLPATSTAAKGAPAPADNALSSFLAVTCNDTDAPESVATYQRDVARDRERYPLFGAASANITPCAYWHHEPAEAPVEVSDDGPSNILIVQNLRDPATPHLGGVRFRAAFGERARLVSIDQGGHGAYVYDDNACGLGVTTAFLLTGDLPDDDVSCEASGTRKVE